jgi:hypothetical protein
MWEPHVSQPYGPGQPVTGIALPILYWLLFQFKYAMDVHNNEAEKFK